MVISLHFFAGGEAKWVRGAPVRGRRRFVPHSIKEKYLDSAVSTASKRNEVAAGLSSASTVRRVRNAG